MKKIKIFLIATVLSLCLAFTLTGCVFTGSYVKNSFVYDVENEYWMTGQFEVIVNEEGYYNCDYTLICFDEEEKEYSRESNHTRFYVNEEEAGKSKTVNFEFHNSNEFNKASISDIKISKEDDEKDLSEVYGIVFGVLGGILLCTAVAVFAICVKKNKTEE